MVIQIKILNEAVSISLYEKGMNPSFHTPAIDE